MAEILMGMQMPRLLLLLERRKALTGPEDGKRVERGRSRCSLPIVGQVIRTGGLILEPSPSKVHRNIPCLEA